MELGRMPEARIEVESIARLADELRQPTHQWLADVCSARLALLEGRFVEAEMLIPRALSLGERAQSWNATVAFRLQLYLLRREQGRVAEVSEVVRGAVEEFPGYPVWRCAWSQITAELGLTGEARQTLDALADEDLAPLRFGEMWLVSMGFLAEAANALHDEDSAPVFYARLLPYADRVAVAYPEISTGSVARYLGLLAAASDHWSDAEGHYDDALVMNEQIGARPWLALTQRDYARMLLSRRAPGDREKAERLLGLAAAIDRELGSPSAD
jgi:tetratricopeptide (TPR) repeat protein